MALSSHTSPVALLAALKSCSSRRTVRRQAAAQCLTLLLQSLPAALPLPLLWRQLRRQLVAPRLRLQLG